MKKFLAVLVLSFLFSGNVYSKDTFKSKLTGKEINYLAKCKTENNQIQMFGFNGYTTLEMATNAPKSVKKIPRGILKSAGNTIGTFHVSRKGKNYAGAAFDFFSEDPDVWTWISGGVSKKKEPYIRFYQLFNNKILSKKNAKLKTTVIFFNDKKFNDIALELYNVGKKSVIENNVETSDDYLMVLVNAFDLANSKVKIPTPEQYKELVNKGGYLVPIDFNCTKI